MRTPLVGLALAALSMLSAGPAFAQGSWFEDFKTRTPRVGELAPDFSLRDTEGNEVTLSALRGEKIVVLEFGAIT
ncbi:MAG: redoxin domain-containing protein [Planctomycetes bacterium]|nr:redoxin domain-containing protein [Planctomycetota bacterium]